MLALYNSESTKITKINRILAQRARSLGQLEKNQIFNEEATKAGIWPEESL